MSFLIALATLLASSAMSLTLISLSSSAKADDDDGGIVSGVLLLRSRV